MPAQVFLFNRLADSGEQVGKQRRLGGGHLMDSGIMFFGHRQEVHRGLGIVVTDYQNIVIFVNRRYGNLFCNDFAEDALGHAVFLPPV